MNTLIEDYKRMRQMEFNEGAFAEFRDLFASDTPVSAQGGPESVNGFA